MKNLLEIIMPASLAVVTGCIVVCLFTLGNHLTPEPVREEVSGCAGMGPLPQPVKLISALPPGAEPGDIAAGDALFKGNCAQCHAVNEVVVGPALAGITKRRPMSWITAWVKNSSKLVASGDEYAVKVFNQYQQQQMPSFQLSKKEIEQIIFYIEDHGYRPAVGTDDVAYTPPKP
ncbi:cytochrome c [Hymenobacter sp. UYP22]|uniref:c-type cytochrome n=1 Tax=Hymenobacter sp. UYP22 TaxID=3156348 RepID=UPI0033998385